MNNIDKINFKETEYFYKNPNALVDYSQMQSFSVIKSSIEIFSYYGINDFESNDIKLFFQRLQLVQKKNGKVFIPSVKKINSVLECCFLKGENTLSLKNGIYHIVSWNHQGYKYEIEAAKAMKKIL